jgi:hypothetical protein
VSVFIWEVLVMGKISLTMAVIIAVVAVPLGGCGAVGKFAEIGGDHPPVPDVHYDGPAGPEPRPPVVEGGLGPGFSPSPGSVEFADENVPALRTVNARNKKAVLEAACNVYDSGKFLAGSDDERVTMIQAKFGYASAKSREIVEVADEIEEFNEHPTVVNGIKVTADAICQGMETAKDIEP